MKCKILLKLVLPIVGLIFLSAVELKAQQFPFYGEIKRFKQLDSVSFPEEGQILFVGSSSFRLWKDYQDYFPDFKIINRGLGGSSLPDIIRYANDIILPYNPRQIVIYCGENDLASPDSTLTPRVILERFSILFSIIRYHFPDIPVAFVSIKPSPSRQHLMPIMEASNALIKAFLEKITNAVYIDVYNPMLAEDGKPKPEIFVEDRLHMNEQGYLIWQKEIMPHLVK